MAQPLSVLVTGARGQLGLSFKDVAQNYPSLNFTFCDRTDLDITDESSLLQYLSQHHFDILINCAAYTAVDKAEVEKEQALLVNFEAVKNLAVACKAKSIQLIHFSTDYVFNGKHTVPYVETDLTDPVNFYGLTKLKGEEACFEYGEHVMVIRTSWVYSQHAKNFVKTMLNLLQTKKEISVVNDQFGSPTYAIDIANAVCQLISASKNVAGIYHYSNKAAISWYEFAQAIKNISGTKCIVRPIPTKDFPTPAARPAYSVFNTSKIEAVLQSPIPNWKNSLAKCIDLLQKG